MEAARLVRAARLRKGLTQRELARRTKIPQPMLSSIERGVQDPRHSTLERILAACDQEIDLFPRAGDGVDRTQFITSLKLSPADRLRRVGEGARWLRTVRRARRVG
ncbi:MAG TPA: helix-turn-helix transcriptional regulator [Candidatus Limnocylindria bacterium]|jgi:transcriptional regulator with XRE-family HTH domain|nr:helix-turn-helix transcriptional regulator [Candidatus Limnocylindria bacterium]